MPPVAGLRAWPKPVEPSRHTVELCRQAVEPSTPEPKAVVKAQPLLQPLPQPLLQPLVQPVAQVAEPPSEPVLKTDASPVISLRPLARSLPEAAGSAPRALVSESAPQWLWLVFALQAFVMLGLLWTLWQQQRTMRDLVRALTQ